jgi:hypothetical protein
VISTGKRAVKTVEKVQKKTTTSIKKLMGYDKYRVELENALEQALQVIAAQETRIRLLEERRDRA